MLAATLALSSCRSREQQSSAGLSQGATSMALNDATLSADRGGNGEGYPGGQTVLERNPVKRDLRPAIPEKEAPHLKVEQAAKLLQYVRGKEFELAVWLNVYVGMRVGEIQALKWESLDLDRGIVHIRATFVRKEHRIKDYPKGKRWHSVQAPPELLELLRGATKSATSEFVVPSPRRAMMTYNSYYTALLRYCKEAGVPEVATHGFRHSTAAIYRAHGATRDDIYHLFKRSSPAVTARYIHDDTEVAKVVRLFPLAGTG